MATVMTEGRHVTRQQRALTQALDHVTAVKQKEGEQVGKIYGALCHSFPVLVRSSGLCQALAFVEAKTSGDNDRARAYIVLRDHVAALLDRSGPGLLDAVRHDGTTDYMRHTRTVLKSWIFYKRFAVSILRVDSAQAAEDAATGEGV